MSDKPRLKPYQRWLAVAAGIATVFGLCDLGGEVAGHAIGICAVVVQLAVIELFEHGTSEDGQNSLP